MQFIEKFRRITSSGDYYPEIDGLRFIAILTVVLFHITSTVKPASVGAINSLPLLTDIYRNGWQGVELFFAISGFIIGLPFARHYILGAKKIETKKYLLRRVTRLEPPYFLALLIFFVILLFSNQVTFFRGLSSLLSSMVYLNYTLNNNVDYLIISVIWSLEIEVQFYIFAIIFSRIFSLNKIVRRLIMISIIIGFPLLHCLYFPKPSTIYNFIHFFTIGFLLVDL